MQVVIDRVNQVCSAIYNFYINPLTEDSDSLVPSLHVSYYIQSTIDLKRQPNVMQDCMKVRTLSKGPTTYAIQVHEFFSLKK